MSTQRMRDSNLTKIPRLITSNLNRFISDKGVGAKSLNNWKKLSRFVDGIKQNKQIDLTGSKIPIRLPT